MQNTDTLIIILGFVLFLVLMFLSDGLLQDEDEGGRRRGPKKFDINILANRKKQKRKEFSL